MEFEVGKQIALDIAITNFMGQPTKLDRVFIFKWENATIDGGDNNMVSNSVQFNLEQLILLCDIFIGRPGRGLAPVKLKSNKNFA